MPGPQHNVSPNPEQPRQKAHNALNYAATNSGYPVTLADYEGFGLRNEQGNEVWCRVAPPREGTFADGVELYLPDRDGDITVRIFPSDQEPSTTWHRDPKDPTNLRAEIVVSDGPAFDGQPLLDHDAKYWLDSLLRSPYLVRLIAQESLPPLQPTGPRALGLLSVTAAA